MILLISENPSGIEFGRQIPARGAAAKLTVASLYTEVYNRRMPARLLKGTAAAFSYGAVIISPGGESV